MSVRHPRLHAAAASFWREWYRELRRHAGDERLPGAVRSSLRGAADRALHRSMAEEARGIVPRVNRRAIASAPPASPRDSSIVALDVSHRPDRLSDAIGLLRSRGYGVERLSGRSGSDRDLLLASAFVICSSGESQHLADETQTPSLRLDARDPFTAYPIRREGLFTLATAIDLDTGRPLALTEFLTERYFRNTRNCGYRPTSSAEISAAVAEMLEGVAGGWSETNAQENFRTAVAEAGVELGARVRHIAEWDAGSGFIGDGRLARVQAERAL